MFQARFTTISGIPLAWVDMRFVDTFKEAHETMRGLLEMLNNEKETGLSFDIQEI